MSPANPKQPSTSTAKPKVEVPHTDVSTAEAKSNREYIIIMIVVSVVIVSIGSFLTYRLFKTYLHRTNEIKALQCYQNALNDKDEALTTLSSNIKTITAVQPAGLSTADVIYHALPTDAEYKTLIGSIENIGNESGVKATISPGGSGTTAAVSTPVATNATSSPTAPVVTPGNTPKPFGFSVNVTGPYDQVLIFLDKTEHSLRPMDFTAMTMTGTTGVIQANISFNTYYQGKADIANKTIPLTDALKQGLCKGSQI